MSESSEKGFLATAISDKGNFKRFLMFLLVLFLFLIGLGYFHSLFFPSSTYELNNGSLYFQFSSSNKVYIWLHSTNKVWENTSIKIGKDEYIKKIYVSGSFNTAIHHLSDGGKFDTRLKFPWLKADGLPNKYELRKVDSMRYKHRITKNANIDQLLLKVFKGDGFDIERYNRGATFKDFDTVTPQPLENGINESFREDWYGTIYLTVNEILLNKNMEKIYAIDSIVDPEYFEKHKDQLEKQRKRIFKKEPYDYDLWFKDNVGQLMLYIEVEKKKWSWIKNVFN